MLIIFPFQQFCVVFFFATPKLECPRRQCQPNPGIQGGGHPEVPLHPTPLRHLQGRLGLADPTGHLLRGHHSALQCLLHRCGNTGGRCLGGTQPAKRERHPGGDPLHHWYVWVFVCPGASAGTLEML